MSTTKHAIPEWGRQTIELIHDRLAFDQRAAAMLQEQVAKATSIRDDHLQAMEDRYVHNLAQLAKHMGLEVPKGSLLTGSLEDYTIEIRYPIEEEPSANQP